VRGHSTQAARQPRGATERVGGSSRARGRPRDQHIDRQVGAAVLQVLRTQGYKAVTIDGIARRVRRARSSIYRRWPSKPHLVAECIVSSMGASPAPDTGVLRRDLTAAVSTLERAFSGPLRQALPGLVADMAHDPELAQAVRRQVLAPRRKSMREALERAHRRGESRSVADLELLLDLLAGPFYFRTLFGHGRVDRRLTTAVVDCVLRIVAQCPRK
jgi:AcrR family transcriptional regulator